MFSALADKDIAGIVEPLLPRVTHWHLAGLDSATSRGLDATRLRERIGDLIGDDRCSLHDDPPAALAAAHAHASPGERVLAFGPVLNRYAAPAN